MSAIDTVRLALPAEAVDIARIQRRAWAEAGMPPEALAAMAADEATRSWHEAIVKPPLASCRVLVAIGQAGVVGFVATGPSADPDHSDTDGTIAEFIVDPVHRRQGHGSRLMNAAVDTLRSDGFGLATFWVRAADDVLRAFFESCGWAADGAHQEVAVDDDGARVRLVRLHSDISAR